MCGMKYCTGRSSPILGCYAAYVSGCLTTLRDTLSVPSWRVRAFFLDCLALQDGTNRLFRNVGKLQSTQYTLRHSPKHWRPHLHLGGGLKSRTVHRKRGPQRLSSTLDIEEAGYSLTLVTYANLHGVIASDNFIFRNPPQTIHTNMKRDVL